ncbi:MAG: PDC sensor domain-containing protein [Trichloromonas sp.]|nr:PDC sensor domain-containing protein [Trichloromonas sp.]
MTVGEPHISHPYTSGRTPGHPAIFLSAPIFDNNGKLIAILGGQFQRAEAYAPLEKTRRYFLLAALASPSRF